LKKRMTIMATLRLCAGLFGLCLWVAQAAPGSALPFIENDYTHALQEAQARNVPLFVEAWAPW